MRRLGLLAIALVVTAACAESNRPVTTALPPEKIYHRLEPSGPRVTSILGISSHLSQSSEPSDTREFELAMLARAGVRTLRTDFKWPSLEPEDNAWTPEGVDTMVRHVHRDAIAVVPILGGEPYWAMPDGSHDEIAPDAFADYAGYVASLWGDRIAHYEIWNEPNFFRFWKPWPHPERYGVLLTAAAQAIRAHDPDARILFGGMISFDPHHFGRYGQWNFLRRVHDAHPQLCDVIDGVAIHPYTFAQYTPPEQSIGLANFPSLSDSIAHARYHLTAMGCSTNDIWLTEVGWPALLVGEDRQAAYLARSLVIAAKARAAQWMWYTFWDGPRYAWYTEESFGLFTPPGDNPRPKPAYHALVTAHKILGALQYAGDLGEKLGWDEDTIRVYAFGDDGGVRVIALWAPTSSREATVPVALPLPDGTQEWTVIDQYGAAIISAAKGPVVTRAGFEVRYILFEK